MSQMGLNANNPAVAKVGIVLTAVLVVALVISTKSNDTTASVVPESASISTSAAPPLLTPSENSVKVSTETEQAMYDQGARGEYTVFNRETAHEYGY